MRYPKLRELNEAIKALIIGPYTSKFPKEPSVAPDGFRGCPKYFNDDCVGCGACAEVCPARAIELKDEGNKRTLTLDYGICHFCGQCERNCITEKGVRLTKEYDLALFDRSKAQVSVEKELLVCEDCKHIVGAKDHIIYLAKKLGKLRFASPLFIFTAQKELRIADDSQSKATPPFKRTEMYRLLCPHCRRELWLADHAK